MTSRRGGFRLIGSVSNPRGFSVKPNFGSVFTEDADLVGMWVTDDPDLRTLSGGSVSSFLNMKSGGLPLVQSTAGQRAELVTDTDLGIEVPDMTNAGNDLYSLTGYSFNAGGPWTMFILAKPTEYSAGGHIIGAYGGSAATQANVRALESAGANLASIRGTYNNVTVNDTSDSLRNLWHAIILAYDGTSKMVRLEVDDRGANLSAAASAEPTITSFSVSHGSLNANFRWATAALWAADLYNAGKAAQLSALYSYIRSYHGMSAGGSGL